MERSSSSGAREAQRAWRELAAARRRHEELTRDADAVAARLAELELLVEGTEGFSSGDEDELRRTRERLRHVSELGEAAGVALTAIAPEEGEGAAELAASAERALAPVERLAPELATAAAELRDVSLRLSEVGSDLGRFLATLDTDPARVEEIEERLSRIADLKRRFDAGSLDELLDRAVAARTELDEAAAGRDPVAAAAAAVAESEEHVGAVAAALCTARREQAPALADAVAAELRELGMGDGEFLVELTEREPSATGADDRVLPRPPEHRSSVCPGRRDCLGR